ncbi:uncharacterized protein LOC128267943 [Anopheles cruzii]|uniref:uncharacterized protein LOC128267943 n=1 Tax=Anopheles cruzii TaxID=68878 RepID=UPI0022EC89BF|nr:uncharacterized protein LOC128267943 [Anopheles cruzii]
MNRVMLKMYYSKSDFLFKTKRHYRNIRQRGGKDDQFEGLVRLLNTPKPNVLMLDLQCTLTSEQIRLLLLKTPELQQVSFSSIAHNGETNGPFPVLAKLKSLGLDNSISDQIDFFRTSMPNLQSLHMFCETGFELETWKRLSGQLKLVHVHNFNTNYVYSFLEITFPLLEDLAMGLYSHIYEGSRDFFQRHPFLRKLSLCGTIPLEWVTSFSRHCPELSHLDLFLEEPEDGYLQSLVQLTKLTHLSLEGEVHGEIFRGAIKSLEFVELNVKYPRFLYEDLPRVAPRLNGLKLKIADCEFYVIELICKWFSRLQHLEVEMGFVPEMEDYERCERLVDLEEHELWRNCGFHYTQHSNVRCLTMLGCSLTDADLNEIPEMFPSLKRLTIARGLSLDPVSDSAFERMHKLMPSCRIDYDDERFYPIGDSASN